MAVSSAVVTGGTMGVVYMVRASSRPRSRVLGVGVRWVGDLVGSVALSLGRLQ